jgi:hypothetical protein
LRACLRTLGGGGLPAQARGRLHALAGGGLLAVADGCLHALVDSVLSVLCGALLCSGGLLALVDGAPLRCVLGDGPSPRPSPRSPRDALSMACSAAALTVAFSAACSRRPTRLARDALSAACSETAAHRPSASPSPVRCFWSSPRGVDHLSVRLKREDKMRGNRLTEGHVRPRWRRANRSRWPHASQRSAAREKTYAAPSVIFPLQS